MSLLAHLTPVIEHLSNLSKVLPYKVGSLSTTQKVRYAHPVLKLNLNINITFCLQVLVVSVSATVGVVAVLARYMRRKKE